VLNVVLIKHSASKWLVGSSRSNTSGCCSNKRHKTATTLSSWSFDWCIKSGVRNASIAISNLVSFPPNASILSCNKAAWRSINFIHFIWIRIISSKPNKSLILLYSATLPLFQQLLLEQFLKHHLILAPALNNQQCNPVEKQHHLDSFIYSSNNFKKRWFTWTI
jgi:hypothetical protein